MATNLQLVGLTMPKITVKGMAQFVTEFLAFRF